MTAERLFLEFQRTRDPAPLGQVFDLCADDLFAVALHLCRDRAAAEDALQSTFLCAIERAHRYAAGRPLRPWLLGILHREVKVQRRRARRQPVAARLGTPAAAPPERAAIDAESRSAVRGAIAALPEPYRAVLELRLVHELGNDAIAERLQRSPGAVRTQLWRGLELLRQLLPKGLALGLAAHLLGRPALAAVRARVFAAARVGAAAGVGAGGIGVALGGLLMKKLLLVGAAVAAFVFVAVQIVPRSGVALPGGGGAAVVAEFAPANDLAKKAEQDARAERETVPVANADAAAPPPAAPPAPQVVELQVVDGKGDPVADTEIALFEREPTQDKDQESQPSEHRRPGEPFARLVADAVGSCRATLARPCFASASKPGVGISGDVWIDLGAKTLATGMRLMLVRPVHVSGRVLQADGTGLRGARVECRRNGWTGFECAAAPLPVVADEGSAFAFDLVPPGTFWLTALGRGNSATVEVDTYFGGPERNVVLQMPGAFSLRGQLLDVDGSPLQGTVYLYRSSGSGCGTDGRFEILLTAGGRYEVVAGAEGRTPARQVVVLDAEHPHRDIVLRVTPFAEIAGHAVDERGRPLGGLWVQPQTERSTPSHLLSTAGPLPEGPTAADGSFHWLVPGDERYRTLFRPIPGKDDYYVRGPDVTPPANDVRIVVHDADRTEQRRGFELRVRAVAAATQRPVDVFRVEVIAREGTGASSWEPKGRRLDDGGFATSPLPAGKDYEFEVQAGGLAPTRIGPFHATERVEEVLVQLPAFAVLDVQVLRADGRPAGHAKVRLHSEALEPFGPTWSREADADGRFRFEQAWPRDWTLSAWMEGVEKDRVDREIALRPGANAPVQVLLRR